MAETKRMTAEQVVSRELEEAARDLSRRGQGGARPAGHLRFRARREDLLALVGRDDPQLEPGAKPVLLEKKGLLTEHDAHVVLNCAIIKVGT